MSWDFHSYGMMDFLRIFVNFNLHNTVYLPDNNQPINDPTAYIVSNLQNPNRNNITYLSREIPVNYVPCRKLKNVVDIFVFYRYNL